jgi:hypothetical protein
MNLYFRREPRWFWYDTLFLWDHNPKDFLEHASEHILLQYNVSSERTYIQCHTFIFHSKKPVFFFNFILQFMYCWFRRKWSTGKLTAKSFVTLFLGFLPWIGFRYKNCPCETHFPVHEKSAVYICTGVKWIVWLRHLMVHCTWMDCAKNCQRWVMQCLLHLMTLQGPLPYACTWGIQ